MFISCQDQRLWSFQMSGTKLVKVAPVRICLALKIHDPTFFILGDKFYFLEFINIKTIFCTTFLWKKKSHRKGYLIFDFWFHHKWGLFWVVDFCKAKFWKIKDWTAQWPFLSCVNVNFMLGLDGFEKVVTNYFLQAALYALVPSIV